MANVIDDYLRKKTEDIVFVELQAGKTVDINGVSLTDDIPLPILVKDMSKQVANGSDINFNVAYFVEGMIRMIGIDATFKHNESYITFLNGYNKDLYKTVLTKGFELINKEQIKEALIYFRAAYTLAPTHVDALYNYARCIEDIAVANDDVYTGFSEEAFHLFTKMKELYPDHYLSYFHLGFHYSNSHDYNHAKELWTSALRMDVTDDIKKELATLLNDNDAKMRFEKGYKFIVEGHSDEGLELLLPLEEEYSDWWNLLFFIGLAYRQQERYEDAIDYFEKTLKYNTGHVDTMNEIGICLMNIGFYEEAERYFKEAIKADLNNHELLCNLGIVYINQGNLAEAEAYLTRAFEVNPLDEITNSWISYLKNLQNKNNN